TEHSDNGSNLSVFQQVNGKTSSNSSIETTSLSPSSETILFPAKKKEELIKVVNHDLGITRNLSRTHFLSNGSTGACEHNDLCRLPCESQPRHCPGSLTGTKADIKHQTNLENHSHFGNHSDAPVPMLSSTMVTVLAPQWSGLLRRTKRIDGTGYSEAQGDLQDVVNTSPNHQGFQGTWNQHGVKNVLTDGSNIPRRVPLLGTRSNTAGWSSKSDPSSLDFNTKKDMIQTVSLDSGALSPSATSQMSWSPLALNSNEQRNPQMDLQGRQPSLSSKPTTSSLLLSFRRFNSNNTNSSQIPDLPEVKPSSQSSSLHNHRPKPILSPSSVSYRTAETGPVLSPVGSNHRERNMSDKFLFLTSPTNIKMKDNSFTQQSQPVQMTQTRFSSSKPQLQGKGPLDRQQNCENSDNTNPFSESDISPTRYFQYDHSAPLKTHTLPKRTNLKSTSWWKQVSQEGSSPIVKNTNNNDYQKPDSPSLTDNKRLGTYMSSYNDNNNTPELVWKENMNLSLKTLSPESEKAANQQHGLNLDNRESQRPQSMPDCVSALKLGTVSAQTTTRHTNVPDKDDERKTLFTAHVPAPTLFTPMTSNPPADHFGKYSGSPPKTTTAPTSQNNMDTQKLTKLPLFHDYTTTPSSRPHAFLAMSDHSSGPNTKNTFSFQSHQVSSNTNFHSSSASTSKFTSKSNVTPLGFKRGYVCLPKPFHSKPVTSLIPTVNTFNKTRGSSLSTTPTTSSATPPRSPSTLSPPVVPAITSPISITASSLLTPPATPVISSPTSEPTPPKLKSIVYNSLEREPKKHGKRDRRVTWQDSVDGHCSDSVSVERPDPSQVQANSPASTKLSLGSSSIFSYQCSGSQEGGGSPVCAPDHKTFNIQEGKGGKYRSLSSDCAEIVTREYDKIKHTVGDTIISDQGKHCPSTTRQERGMSVESGTVQCHYSTPVSLPLDFPSGYKHRYSTPPYSTLMSTRQTQGESKTSAQTFLISQPSLSTHTPQPSSNADQYVSKCKPPLSPVRPSQIFSIPILSGTAQQGSSKGNLSDTGGVNRNTLQDHTQDQPNSQIQLLDNRIHITSQSLKEDEKHSFSSTYVTETLVYRIKSKADTATEALKNTKPTSSQHNTNTFVSVETGFNQQPHSAPSKATVEQSCRLSDQIPTDGRPTKSEPSLDEPNNTSMKESVLSKNRFCSVEVNNEQSPKKSRFGIKRSISTPSSSLSRSESERVTKSYNKVDQMFSKLKQKFSSRRTEDDLSFPWKWKRTSQTPSISGSSDKSSVSDVSADSTKTLEDRTQEKEMALKDSAVKTEDTKRQLDNRYILIPALSVGETKADNDLSIWSESAVQETDPNYCTAQQSKLHLTVHGPVEQFDLYENSGTKRTATSLSCSDHSVDGSLSPNAAYPSQCKKSTPSPRSPFSPFSSLSPVSPFSTAEMSDDNVFYSPKLQRRRESSSPFEPREGIRLGVSRRSRASTGPPTPSPGKDKEPFTSSYADLKYGIEPGRSFSVSSVLSSRPPRPGRISTGTRFMSVGDLSQPALSCASNSSELHRWSITPAEVGQFYTQPDHDPHMSHFPYDDGRRSRSLPRSLTQCLAKWSSGVPPSQSSTGTPSKPGLIRSPSINICHFSWDTEGPPTPPPTPPLSPVIRRMSKPPSLPSPTFPSSPEAVEQADSQSSRAHRPSRGYVSSLDTFEESSDSSSDTTTDDEYYIDSEEDGGKETEL
ncbi:hypothetical protein XENOCAPTIV_027789, partial [Xenoophorus captivus]